MKNIPKPWYNFLLELSVNNNREWFEENKPRYLEIKNQTKLFAAHVFWALNSFDSSLQIPGEKPYLFRIYRDARFAKGKPFKNHFWFLFSQGGKPMMHQRWGFYLHIQPWNTFLIAGIWRPEPFLLKNIRKNINEDSTEIKNILENKKIKKYFSLRWEQVKTAPKWYKKDNENIALLRYKEFYLLRNFSDEEVLSENFFDEIVSSAKIALPINQYLNKLAVK